jgi:hypothetical protein
MAVSSFPQAVVSAARDKRISTGVPCYIRSAAVKVMALQTLPAARPAFPRGC